jgi:hypothetical protein
MSKSAKAFKSDEQDAPVTKPTQPEPKNVKRID